MADQVAIDVEEEPEILEDFDSHEDIDMEEFQKLKEKEEKRKAKAKANYAKNKEKLQARNKEYRLKNKDKVKESQKKAAEKAKQQKKLIKGNILLKLANGEEITFDEYAILHPSAKKKGKEVTKKEPVKKKAVKVEEEEKKCVEASSAPTKYDPAMFI